WRLTFLVNVPFGIIILLLACAWFPRPLLRPAPQARGSRRTSMDPVGSVLLGIAVLAILFPFVESGSSSAVWARVPVGARLVGGRVRWEQRYRQRGRSPMVDLGLFATRSFSDGTVIVSLYFLGMTSVWLLVALYMQIGVGRSALEAGTVGIPAAIM